ncbi:hypothetical protein [Phreatobacter sp.]|uniref:hypothetical protein n=1 Tax=Phreatobacter sp. TaxID=1966341 RepID=UPI003F711533
MAEMCANCRNFWQPPRGDNGGLCRAHPPIAQGDGTALWPSVSRSDWCGEYRVSPPPPNPGIRRLVTA